MQETMPEPAMGYGGGVAQMPTRFRWVICGLLLYATTINYVDRSILNALAPLLQKEIGWRDYQFGLINSAFTLAYAIGFLIMGRLVDAVGTRIGYAVALVFWTLAALATAFTRTPLQFGMARFGLGLGEAGNFPAAIKTVAEWFPQKERATATGIFNAGSNIGAIIAPIIALTIVPLFGWRAAFCVTPILAVVWIFLWVTFYRNPNQHRLVNQAERDLIGADTAGSVSTAAGAVVVKALPVRWRSILPHRQTWAFMMAKFLTDPIWWFYLFWSGKFFNERFGADLKGLALPLIYVYVLADVGSIAGGWFSSSLIKKGWTPNAARKTAMATCAGLILPVICAPMVPTEWPGALWIAATLIGVAAAAHQGFSANIFTTTSDMFPKRAISSIVGLGGLAGALGGMIMQAAAGVIKEVTNSYVIMFVIAGTVYVLAVVVFHLLVPRMEVVEERDLETKTLPAAAWAGLAAVLGAIIGVPLSYVFQSGVAKGLLNFQQYLSGIVTGDLFKRPDRREFVGALGYTPLGMAVVMAVVGLVIYAVAFRPRGGKAAA